MNTYMTPLILKRYLKVDPIDLYTQANQQADSYLSMVYAEGYASNFYEDATVEMFAGTKWACKVAAFVITSKGKQYATQATNADIFPDFDLMNGTSSDKAKAHLWMHLLMKGKVFEPYQGYGIYGEHDWAPPPALLHLLICGLDFEQSTTPSIAGWESFSSTFDPPDQHTGLVGYATCRCEEYEQVEVVLTNGTFENMIPVILGEDA